VEVFVIAALDTLLIALYVELTDRVIPTLGKRRRGPGRPPQVTDAELVCLAVAQVLLRYHDERHWLRAAPTRVGHLFPRLLGQSAYNRRLKDLAPLLEAALRWLADKTPGRRSGCGCWTARRWAAASPPSPPNARTCSAPPATATSPPTAATTGGSSSCWCGPPRGRSPGSASDEHDPGIFPNWLRQRVEAIIWTLKHQLGLEDHGGRVPAGLWARVVQRLLALNTAIWHNWQIGAPTKRSLLAYDH